jgi:nicotinamide-nucleotide amidase
MLPVISAKYSKGKDKKPLLTVRTRGITSFMLEKAGYPKDVLAQARRLGRKLSDRALFLAVAESCTGGLVGALCTEIPGSSSWFAGGIIAYANRAKETLLGVPAAVLAGQGAVSEPVVRGMARGILAAFGVGAGLAVSGLAGPEGGSPEKPVGTVWIAAALAARGGEVCLASRRYCFPGDRGAIRLAAAVAALSMVDALLEEATGVWSGRSP